MESIYIKKKQHNDESELSFVVPAVAIQTRDGNQRFIPHPYGNATKEFSSVEEAISHIHRAGYDAEFDNKRYPAPQRQSNRPSQKVKGRPKPELQLIQSAIPFLQEQLEDKTPGVVASAAYALGEAREEYAIPGLIHCLSHDDATVRKNASEALAKIGRSALNPIQLALRDSNWVVRHSAIGSVLEMLHHNKQFLPEMIPHVQPLLKDDHWLVRSQTAILYGDMARLLQEQREDDS